MAAAPPSLQKELEHLNEDLTCPVCHEEFEDPKLLPCGHVYCRECVLQLVTRARQRSNTTFPCPECRKDTPLPRNDPDELPTAFFVNRMKDHCSRLEGRVVQYTAPVRSAQAHVPTCPEHDDPLKLFCFNCNRLICRDCTVLKHAGHHFEFVKTAAPCCSELLGKALSELQVNKTNLVEACKRIEETETEICEQIERTADSIHRSFAELHEVLRLREQELLRKATTLKEQKVTSLTAQKASLEASITEVKQIEDNVQRVLSEAKQEELLESHKQFLREMETKSRHCAGLYLEPAEKPNIGVRLHCADQVREVCEKHSNVYIQADVSKCTIEGVKPVVTIRQRTCATIAIKYSNGVPCMETQVVKARLHNVSCGSSLPVEVVEKQAGVYEASYCPDVRGRHQLTVEVNSSPIAGSPFPFFVTILPTELGKPVRVIEPMRHPSSLAFTNSELIVVTSKGHRPKVSIIDKHGNRLSEITGYELQNPNGVAVDDENNIYVTDLRISSLLKYDAHGHLLKKAGGYGSEPGKFIQVGEVLVFQNKLVLVSDHGGHRIQVFDKDLNFIRRFGSRGSMAGRFNDPEDLCCDKTGQRLYIADSGNHRIQVFTPEGKALSAFGGKGSHSGRLECPLNVCLDRTDSFLFVSDIGGHRISVFKTNGQFVTSFGSPELAIPTRVAMDQDGYLYVGDFGNSRIQVF